MRYRLGEFRPTPDLVGMVLRAHGGMQGRPGSSSDLCLMHVIRLLAQADHSPEGVLEELLESGLPSNGSMHGGAPRRLVLELMREREVLRELPDLLTCAATPESDRGWASEVHDALCACRERRAGLRLLECASVPGPEGYVAIAGTNQRLACDVRPGDRIYAGFVAIRRREGELTVLPRVHRVSCTNGLIAYDATGEDALEREGSVGAAIAHCLSGAVVEKAAHWLRTAARTPLADPLAEFPEVEHEETRTRIRAEWEARGDSTLFGALNAATAVARSEAHFARRLALECAAGHLLELRSFHPQRRPAPAPESVRPPVPPRREMHV